jgi:ABC-type ATPase involved in cell division
VEREAEASALRRILVPKQAAVHCFFYFVTGPSGGGKTTMVQRICHQARPHLICLLTPACNSPSLPLELNVPRYRSLKVAK